MKPAASADSTAGGKEDVVQLSPFEINEEAEDKWNASSTLLGNRTNQELIKVPVTIDVLTRDFMYDIGVFNGDDAGAFIAAKSLDQS